MSAWLCLCSGQERHPGHHGADDLQTQRQPQGMWAPRRWDSFFRQRRPFLVRHSWHCSCIHVIILFSLSTGVFLNNFCMVAVQWFKNLEMWSSSLCIFICIICYVIYQIISYHINCILSFFLVTSVAEKLDIKPQDRSKFFGVGGRNVRKLRSETGECALARWTAVLMFPQTGCLMQGLFPVIPHLDVTFTAVPTFPESGCFMQRLIPVTSHLDMTFTAVPTFPEVYKTVPISRFLHE